MKVTTFWRYLWINEGLRYYYKKKHNVLLVTDKTPALSTKRPTSSPRTTTWSPWQKKEWALALLLIEIAPATCTGPAVPATCKERPAQAIATRAPHTGAGIAPTTFRASDSTRSATTRPVPASPRRRNWMAATRTRCRRWGSLNQGVPILWKGEFVPFLHFHDLPAKMENVLERYATKVTRELKISITSNWLSVDVTSTKFKILNNPLWHAEFLKA